MNPTKRSATATKPSAISSRGKPARNKRMFATKNQRPTIVYDVPALKPGTYFFRCDLHPNMNGTLNVRG